MTDDDAWREIVENYGDTPSVEDLRTEVAAEASAPEQDSEPDPAPQTPLFWHPDPDDEQDYIPPDEPLPRPAFPTLIAWLGVLGMPAIVIALLVLRVAIPTWGAVGFVMWFLGGFGYLVSTMPKQREDPWDDGARL